MLKPPKLSYTELVSKLQNIDQWHNWRGFQAQQPKDQSRRHVNSSTQQRCPPAPGECRMTPAERDLYRKNKSTPHDDIPQAFVALTQDTNIAETKWKSDTRELEIGHLVIIKRCKGDLIYSTTRQNFISPIILNLAWQRLGTNTALSIPDKATTAQQPCSSTVIEPVQSVPHVENFTRPQPSTIHETVSATPQSLPPVPTSRSMIPRSQHGIIKPNPKTQQSGLFQPLTTPSRRYDRGRNY
ncbi:hypothetical protein SADUNF_Sadunf03G0098100 [Salix dunnii]|uniref:Uncharacterized protein n=1 Tax=Salix dunnii TaxID=1413687 RepID=A0A835KEB0_9ROSI|nr:hypothetical protein SADUNF_Sadunf03G0098100 [Salix dunnii]